MPSSAQTPEAIRILRAERERLREEQRRGRSGSEIVEALTAAIDAAVIAVWDTTAASGERMALVALGGYGRREQAPHSDIDLMVLHASARLAPDAGKQLFYELWDAGFAVGHAIRTVKESLAMSAANLEVETSFLDARLLSGDAGLFEEFRSAALRKTRKRGAKFLRALRESAEARYATNGYASYWLEPNIKDGAGGLRDRSMLGWLTRVFDEGEVAERLAAAEPDGAEVRAAADFLFRVRNELHFSTDRRSDVLELVLHDPVAAALGYTENGRPPVDQFLRELYGAARAIEFTLQSALGELEAALSRKGARSSPVAGVTVESGRVVAAGPVTPGDPVLPMRVFATAAREGAPVSAGTIALLRTRSGDGPGTLGWNGDVRRAFMDILASGERGTHALEAMDQAGLLTRYLPEWEGVRRQPQHNVYHRFTVDVHLLQTVAAACALGDDGGTDPLARDVWHDVRDHDRLLIACLLHDVGKGTAEDHSILGESLAARAGERMGIGPVASAEVTWLVRHHLLLPDTATRRDVDDENLVVETAASIGDAERLKMLYLLSVADGRATGPAAWGSWKAKLVGELFTKVLHVLERGDVATPRASDLVRLRRTELRQALARHPQTVVYAHISGMTREYLMAFPTVTLARHFALMAPDLGPIDVVTHVAHTDAAGVYELTVVARDRPGLFSTIAGAIALGGINVLGAQIFTRADGVALEVFRVEGAFEREVEDTRWERVASDARAALEGRLDLDRQIAEKRDTYARPSKGKRESTKVHVDNLVSDFYTVVEVQATDRVGLLYEITRALADLSLDIHTAKVATYAHDVVDAFYVRDEDGQKLTRPEQKQAIERGVLARIGE